MNTITSAVETGDAMQLTTTFTPGPWNIHPKYQTINNEPTQCQDFDALTISIGAGEKLIGHVEAYKVKTDGYRTGYPRVTDYDENRANAYLIAAAPELYETLQVALRAEETRLYSLPPSDDYETSVAKDGCSARIGRYRAALAKADGRQP